MKSKDHYESISARKYANGALELVKTGKTNNALIMRDWYRGEKEELACQDRKERGAYMKTEIERVSEIRDVLLAHEPIIDVPYEQLNDIAVALVKEGYGNISEYKAEIARLKEETSNIRKETAKEIYEKTKEKDSYLLVWEYGEGYLDCLKNLGEVISEYDIEVAK